MSTAILPDDSVLVRLEHQTVHIDARTRAIHIRAASLRDELGGSILASYPLAAADRVRLCGSAGGRFWLYLELRSGRRIDLGDAPSQDVGMLTARVIADLTRCKIELSQGEVESLPGPKSDPVGRLVSAVADPLADPSAALGSSPPPSPDGDEAPTQPPAGPMAPRRAAPAEPITLPDRTPPPMVEPAPSAPSAQASALASQAHPPTAQAHSAVAQAHPPTAQAHSAAAQAHPPAAQAHPPAAQARPPAAQASAPAAQARPPAAQACAPQGGQPPDDEVFVPSPRARVDVSTGSESFVPPPPSRAPVASAPDATVPTDPDGLAEPIFMQLLRESEFLSAMAPGDLAALESADDLAPPAPASSAPRANAPASGGKIREGIEKFPSLPGAAPRAPSIKSPTGPEAPLARSRSRAREGQPAFPGQSRQQALIELLRLTSERLPVAPADVEDGTS